MPFATSVEELVDTITQKLPAGTLIPLAVCVRLQFWPTDTTTDRALKHTGRFKVKMKVKSRQIRGWHEDTRYLKQIMYMKRFAVLYREHALLLWEDDKAIVPLGEPGKPVGTGVHSHNKSLASVEGPTVSALDHDHHVASRPLFSDQKYPTNQVTHLS